MDVRTECAKVLLTDVLVKVHEHLAHAVTSLEATVTSIDRIADTFGTFGEEAELLRKDSSKLRSFCAGLYGSLELVYQELKKLKEV